MNKNKVFFFKTSESYIKQIFIMKDWNTLIIVIYFQKKMRRHGKNVDLYAIRNFIYEKTQR